MGRSGRGQAIAVVRFPSKAARTDGPSVAQRSGQASGAPTARQAGCRSPRSAGASLELVQALAPPDDHRLRGGQPDLQRDTETGRPPVRGAERVGRPIACGEDAAHFSLVRYRVAHEGALRLHSRTVHEGAGRARTERRLRLTPRHNRHLGAPPARHVWIGAADCMPAPEGRNARLGGGNWRFAKRTAHAAHGDRPRSCRYGAQFTRPRTRACKKCDRAVDYQTQLRGNAGTGVAAPLVGTSDRLPAPPVPSSHSERRGTGPKPTACRARRASVQACARHRSSLLQAGMVKLPGWED
jgi:hypothetical protein